MRRWSPGRIAYNDRMSINLCSAVRRMAFPSSCRGHKERDRRATLARLLALTLLVVVAGRQPFLSDAVVSGIGGRENDFIEQLLRSSKSAARGGDVLRYSVSAILKSGDAPRIERMMGILGSEQTPEWARIPMLAGRRSLNLSNAAAVVVYEAWRQQGFSGAV